ncbi:unnamed protein product [Chondrus crispus]|uniref:DUF1995 domain-containing protein n=1 Tax=Chondrus crispus TaxID=2769 RepID=R7QTI1_CHOCR|nr:unnamed protein product [Chondrus crispus]CDF40821.1 unnamed protein product [Chondrus crispus]|eukprot:XP_005711115.1 unnamed protein product [Chondrus crispus]
MRVELPMGRSRRFWYRMSPPAMAVRESSVLALHFAQIFKGLRLVIAMAEGAEPAQKVDWAAVVDLSDASRVVRDAEVVVVVGAGAGRRREVDQVLEASRLARAVVLFNCLMDAPIEDRWERAEDVYVCRAMDKCAVLREGAGAPWSVFVEIAVFEYEWVGDRREEAGWVPAQGNVERYVASRGASKKVKGYWSTAFSGCEGGFWPFMTIAMTETLPIDGRAMEEERQEKAEKKNKKAGRPFGFF